jgi:hypothetical protein
MKCHCPVEDGHLTCRTCWYAIPGAIQREVRIRLHGWKNKAAARDFLSSHLKSAALAKASEDEQ